MNATKGRQSVPRLEFVETSRTASGRDSYHKEMMMSAITALLRRIRTRARRWTRIPNAAKCAANMRRRTKSCNAGSELMSREIREAGR